MGDSGGAVGVPAECPVGSRASWWGEATAPLPPGSPASLPSPPRSAPPARAAAGLGLEVGGWGWGWCERRGVAWRGGAGRRGAPRELWSRQTRCGRGEQQPRHIRRACSPAPASPWTEAQANITFGALLSPTQPLRPLGPLCSQQRQWFFPGINGEAPGFHAQPWTALPLPAPATQPTGSAAPPWTAGSSH